MSTLTQIIDYARLAPSVHNVQPWRFSLDENSITLSIEPSRTLDAGDPTRRELWVSMGICLETTLQAARGLGFTPSIDYTQTDTITRPVARITMQPGVQPQPDIVRSITQRHSYRGSMKKTTIPDDFIAQCQSSLADLRGISVIFTDDQALLHLVADITEKGMRVALSSSEFRKELAPLLHSNWSGKRTGLHGFAMDLNFIESVWQKVSVMFGIDTKKQGRADRQRVLESSGLLFITAKGDVPSFWLDVGRGYMRIALHITKQGYSHSTLTAPVEAGRFHEDIERKLNTTDRIQSMIRIGMATKTMRPSPRLTKEELIT